MLFLVFIDYVFILKLNKSVCEQQKNRICKIESYGQFIQYISSSVGGDIDAFAF